MGRFTKIWQFLGDLIFGSKYARTIGVAFNSILGGVLTNWFVTDLSLGGKGMKWSGALQSAATYWLAVFIAFFLLYTYFLYRYEKGLYEWNNPEFIKALSRKELVPAMLQAMKKRIENGERPTLEALEKELSSK